MNKTVQTLLIGACLTIVGSAAWAQSAPNPLDRFRTNMGDNGSQQGTVATQAVPARNTVAPNNHVPAPTAGGMQQQGLSQDQINEALQGYDFQGDMTLEERQAEVERMARDTAFQATLNGTFPLKPDEILELLDRYREVREATEGRIGGAPKTDITLQSVSLDPGQTPPIIKLSPGYVTTLNIVDLTGRPWPVRDVSWGGNFEIIQPEAGEHVIRISPLKAHEVGNLSIQLLELDTPVIFSLQTQLETVDVRFDAQIPEYGPNADTPIIENTSVQTTAGNEDIIKVLDGVPTVGAKKLDLTGVDGRTSAYDVGGQIYVRTPLSLLSPGWNSSITSADGTTVYSINKSPVLLLSDKGKMVRAIIDYK